MIRLRYITAHIEVEVRTLFKSFHIHLLWLSSAVLFPGHSESPFDIFFFFFFFPSFSSSFLWVLIHCPDTFSPQVLLVAPEGVRTKALLGEKQVKLSLSSNLSQSQKKETLTLLRAFFFLFSLNYIMCSITHYIHITYIICITVKVIKLKFYQLHQRK